MKRYLSLWFPDWPLIRLKRAQTNRLIPQGKANSCDTDRAEALPFVLIENGTHGLRIASANQAAQLIGLTEGLSFTDAKARVPNLRHQDIDRVADAKALEALAKWMIRFAPLVALDGSDGVMLETTGCDHLYGGETAMVAEVSKILAREQIPHRTGLASTQVAASAVARGASGQILSAGYEKDGLSDLPISALRVSNEAETLLRRFGLNQIGQLYSIDRKALARRFQSKSNADAVLLKLDQALGDRRDPIKPLRPAPAKRVELKCPEPIASRDDIELGLEKLTIQICTDLKTFGQGARHFTLVAYKSDGTLATAEISAARPVNMPSHILRLFSERIDRIDPGFGIDLLTLEARRTGPMDESAVALSSDLAARDTDPIALSALADRMTAKLGEGVVQVTAFKESHRPNLAEQKHSFKGDIPKRPSPNRQAGPRPLRLLRRPERVQVLAEVPEGPPLRFVWRRVARKVAKADGPERIAPEWWTYTALPPAAALQEDATRKWLTPKFDPRADAALIAKTRTEFEQMQTSESINHLPRARDYYRVEDKEGRRYWVFREGLYDDGRGGSPDWYIHGLFA
ncbi:MAG: DNA polymerase Y family protein [Pseudomonadota bacterium]